MWGAIFPGQGSQQIGMGQFLFDNFKVAKELFEEASDSLSLDFKKLCFTGSEDDLALTHNTQPALLLVSTCYSKVIQETTGVPFKYAAGHSIGEYAALVMAETLKFSDAIKAVRKRGEEMQKAVPVGDGSMLAVLGLDDQQVEKLVAWALEKSGLFPIECANFNSPGQVVLSGSSKALAWLSENMTKDIFPEPPRRLKAIPLKVSAPFHCSMMMPAQNAMKEFFETIDFNDAKVPVVQNTTAQAESKADVLKDNLTKQISASVLWTQSINWMQEQGVGNYIELGHGKVLAGLNKKINPAIKTINVSNLEDLNEVEKLCLT